MGQILWPLVPVYVVLILIIITEANSLNLRNMLLNRLHSKNDSCEKNHPLVEATNLFSQIPESLKLINDDVIKDSKLKESVICWTRKITVETDENGKIINKVSSYEITFGVPKNVYENLIKIKHIKTPTSEEFVYAPTFEMIDTNLTVVKKTKFITCSKRKINKNEESITTKSPVLDETDVLDSKLLKPTQKDAVVTIGPATLNTSPNDIKSTPKEDFDFVNDSNADICDDVVNIDAIEKLDDISSDEDEITTEIINFERTPDFYEELTKPEHKNKHLLPPVTKIVEELKNKLKLLKQTLRPDSIVEDTTFSLRHPKTSEVKNKFDPQKIFEKIKNSKLYPGNLFKDLLLKNKPASAREHKINIENITYDPPTDFEISSETSEPVTTYELNFPEYTSTPNTIELTTLLNKLINENNDKPEKSTNCKENDTLCLIKEIKNEFVKPSTQTEGERKNLFDGTNVNDPSTENISPEISSESIDIEILDPSSEKPENLLEDTSRKTNNIIEKPKNFIGSTIKSLIDLPIMRNSYKKCKGNINCAVNILFDMKNNLFKPGVRYENRNIAFPTEEIGTRRDGTTDIPKPLVVTDISETFPIQIKNLTPPNIPIEPNCKLVSKKVKIGHCPEQSFPVSVITESLLPKDADLTFEYNMIENAGPNKMLVHGKEYCYELTTIKDIECTEDNLVTVLIINNHPAGPDDDSYFTVKLKNPSNIYSNCINADKNVVVIDCPVDKDLLPIIQHEMLPNNVRYKKLSQDFNIESNDLIVNSISHCLLIKNLGNVTCSMTKPELSIILQVTEDKADCLDVTSSKPITGFTPTFRFENYQSDETSEKNDVPLKSTTISLSYSDEIEISTQTSPIMVQNQEISTSESKEEPKESEEFGVQPLSNIKTHKTENLESYSTTPQIPANQKYTVEFDVVTESTSRTTRQTSFIDKIVTLPGDVSTRKAEEVKTCSPDNIHCLINKITNEDIPADDLVKGVSKTKVALINVCGKKKTTTCLKINKNIIKLKNNDTVSPVFVSEENLSDLNIIEGHVKSLNETNTIFVSSVFESYILFKQGTFKCPKNIQDFIKVISIPGKNCSESEKSSKEKDNFIINIHPLCPETKTDTCMYVSKNVIETTDPDIKTDKYTNDQLFPKDVNISSVDKYSFESNADNIIVVSSEKKKYLLFKTSTIKCPLNTKNVVVVNYQNIDDCLNIEETTPTVDEDSFDIKIINLCQSQNNKCYHISKNITKFADDNKLYKKQIVTSESFPEDVDIESTDLKQYNEKEDEIIVSRLADKFILKKVGEFDCSESNDDIIIATLLKYEHCADENVDHILKENCPNDDSNCIKEFVADKLKDLSPDSKQCNITVCLLNAIQEKLTNKSPTGTTVSIDLPNQNTTLTVTSKSTPVTNDILQTTTVLPTKTSFEIELSTPEIPSLKTIVPTRSELPVSRSSISASSLQPETSAPTKQSTISLEEVTTPLSTTFKYDTTAETESTEVEEKTVENLDDIIPDSNEPEKLEDELNKLKHKLLLSTETSDEITTRTLSPTRTETSKEDTEIIKLQTEGYFSEEITQAPENIPDVLHTVLEELSEYSTPTTANQEENKRTEEIINTPTKKTMNDYTVTTSTATEAPTTERKSITNEKVHSYFDAEILCSTSNSKFCLRLSKYIYDVSNNKNANPKLFLIQNSIPKNSKIIELNTTNDISIPNTIILSDMTNIFMLTKEDLIVCPENRNNLVKIISIDDNCETKYTEIEKPIDTPSTESLPESSSLVKYAKGNKIYCFEFDDNMGLHRLKCPEDLSNIPTLTRPEDLKTLCRKKLKDHNKNDRMTMLRRLNIISN